MTSEFHFSIFMTSTHSCRFHRVVSQRGFIIIFLFNVFFCDIFVFPSIICLDYVWLIKNKQRDKYLYFINCSLLMNYLLVKKHSGCELTNEKAGFHVNNTLGLSEALELTWLLGILSMVAELYCFDHVNYCLRWNIIPWEPT